MSTFSRTLRAIALGSALIVVPTVAAAIPASAAAATCPAVTWGSLPKAGGGAGAEALTNVRAGRHACFDRVVFDIRGAGAANFHVEYVDQVFTDGGGFPVPLAGGAFLEVVVMAPSFDINTGDPTFNPADPNHVVNVTGFRTLRQVASAGSFEGQSNFGIGVRARLPMRVFALNGPGDSQRLVVDIAHRWGTF